MNNSYKEFIAEYIGTMLILLFGNGVCAMVTLFNSGSHTDITFSWGIGVFLGIIVSSKISGAHLNPAITIALVITKRHPLSKVWHYVLGQLLGGFSGAGVVYFFYRSKILIVDPTLSNSSNIFTTFPAIPQFFPSFMAEFIATFILMFTILAIIEHFSKNHVEWISPFAIGILIVAIGMSFGGMHGYAMNPARDFMPRLFITLLGFKNNGLLDGNNVWIVPVVAPILGAICGAIIYDITIGFCIKFKENINE